MEAWSCDIAVVGAGPAGCAVAGRLVAESDADVVLVEAGPDYGSLARGGWPADVLDAATLATSHGWGYTSGPLPTRDPIDFSRARIVGGCSAHNGCVAAVGCPQDYDCWAALTGDDGWSADALRPVLSRALGRMRVRVYDEDELGPFHRAALDAAASLGWPRADDLVELDGGVGFGVEPVNVVDGTRFNAAFAYLDPVRGHPGLRVVDRSLCDRLVLSGGGVDVHCRRDGAAVVVRARTVVLAAGAYGSPAILLRSGIGDPSELRRHGIRPVVALPGVGCNLHDHPLFELALTAAESLDALLREASAHGFVPEEQTLGKLRSSRATGPYDLHVFPVTTHVGEPVTRALIAVSAMEARSRGRLTLAGADAASAPLIDHGYLSDPDGHDLAVLVEGVGLARELAAAEPLRSLLGAELHPGPGADLAGAIRRTHTHYFHPAGTCAMGKPDDPLAVCDSQGRVLGAPGVVVADCSLMPVVPRANTNIPAVLVGERIADVLLDAGGAA